MGVRNGRESFRRLAEKGLATHSGRGSQFCTYARPTGWDVTRCPFL